MFPLWQIANSTLIAAVVSGVVLMIWRNRSRMSLTRDVVVPVLLVGLSVLIWRSVGNVAQLNDDPIPGLSPNDLLCPVITYTFLGCYGAFRDQVDLVRWQHIRVALTLITLIVNVVTIWIRLLHFVMRFDYNVTVVTRTQNLS